ncbi:MAG TPA: Gfo/Idh/MocA family oxidoreductase, partial [Allosphingosinicella sp.]|nr:Gfo/Idh/MocA family oxidoreductase [Allosphingosinicella sp.]
MTRPRLGFLGVGWIGRNRMEAMLATGAVEALAIADASPAAAHEAQRLAPAAKLVGSLDELLALSPDGVVIATPSARHAEQAIRALDAGAAVFCQKPLGRTAQEVEAVLAAARGADRLLGIDLSYRHTQAVSRIRQLLDEGVLGEVFAADLVFHNGYGPDKAWFYDPAQSGGGCVMDLGVHLVDLALWMLGFPQVVDVASSLYAAGRPLREGQVEDYAAVTLTLGTGATVRIACSWRLQVGCDAVISADFYGTQGGAAMRNVGGSFYDFEAEHFTGTTRRALASPPDAWGGRAASQWARSLAAGQGFADSTTGLLETARVLDRIYGRPSQAGRVA